MFYEQQQNSPAIWLSADYNPYTCDEDMMWMLNFTEVTLEKRQGYYSLCDSMIKSNSHDLVCHAPARLHGIRVWDLKGKWITSGKPDSRVRCSVCG